MKVIEGASKVSERAPKGAKGGQGRGGRWGLDRVRMARAGDNVGIGRRGGRSHLGRVSEGVEAGSEDDLSEEDKGKEPMHDEQQVPADGEQALAEGRVPRAERPVDLQVAEELEDRQEEDEALPAMDEGGGRSTAEGGEVTGRGHRARSWDRHTKPTHGC